MVKLEAIWTNIPFHFKKDVVGYLDYKDRCALRRCSHSDKVTVDACHVSLSQVAIKICPDYSIFSYSETGDTIISVKFKRVSAEISDGILIETTESPAIYKPGKNQKTSWKTTKTLVGEISDTKLAITEFMMVTRKLKCKRILINDVIITSEYHPELNSEEMIAFQKEFIAMFLSSNNETKIEAETIRLNLELEKKYLKRIIEKFDEKSLTRIEFVDQNVSWNLKELAETKQWKNLKNIYLHVRSDLDVDDVIHADRVQMYVTDAFQPTDVWRVIQSFISKNQHGAAFHFSYKNEHPDVGAILNTFNVPPNDQPIRAGTQLRNALNQRFVHTQRFPMPSPNLTLLVMISDREVMGTVCHVANVDKEAIIEMGVLR